MTTSTALGRRAAKANARPHAHRDAHPIENAVEGADRFRKRKREEGRAPLSYSPRKPNFVVRARQVSTGQGGKWKLVSLPYALCCDSYRRPFACRHLLRLKGVIV